MELDLDTYAPAVCFAGNPCFEPALGALAPDLSLRSFQGRSTSPEPTARACATWSCCWITA